MKCSVIIPTYNGAHKIVNLMRALAVQSVKDFEVIVVIDGSTDDTRAVLDSTDFGIQSVKVIEQSNKGRAAVRNAGADVAGTGMLVFFDDDMIPGKNCIEEHLHHHDSISGTILTGAQEDIGGDEESDIQQYKAFLSKKWSAPLKKSGPMDKDTLFLTAANFSVAKNIFTDLGGFDNSLGDAEDFDLAVRALEKGVPIYYRHEAFALHNDRITCASYIRRQRQYRKAHEKLRTEKPELHLEFSRTLNKVPPGWKGMMMRLFAFRFWIWTVDSCNWLKLFPRKLRYRFYDVIIAANGMYFPERVSL